MATYVAYVTETRNYEVEYLIEADSQEEAEHKAAIGDTVDETELGGGDVTDRYVAEVNARGPKPDEKFKMENTVRFALDAESADNASYFGAFARRSK